MTDDLLGRLVAWAAARPDIRAVILTGSRARDDGTVDEASDVDIELFTADPGRYEADDAWVHEIGPVWVTLALRRPDDARYRMRLVLFEGGAKADLAIAPPALLEEMADAGRLSELYERGYRTLIDRDGLAARLPSPSGRPPTHGPPSAEAFRAVVDEFWFEASHIPKLLGRGELWVVKFRDWTMKELLRQMIEWHALALRGAETDVWHIGIRMQQWAAPGVWEELDAAFGRFDAEDARRAFLATAALFGRLARETAERLGHDYPAALERSVMAVDENES
jgi:aminoglycoside 6-adenylyltransferase